MLVDLHGRSLVFAVAHLLISKCICTLAQMLVHVFALLLMPLMQVFRDLHPKNLSSFQFQELRSRIHKLWDLQN